MKEYECQKSKEDQCTEPDGSYITGSDVADMLMDFTDVLFYNFRTYEASQKAIARIADYLDICRAVVCISSRKGASPVQVLYTSDAVIDENTPIEEKSLRSIDGATYVYRIYRRNGAVSLDMMQRRAIEFVFKLLHTYLNRQSSMEMGKYAQTHDMMYDCLNSNGMNEALRQYCHDGVDLSQYAIVFMNVCKFMNINARVGFENGNKVMRFIVNTLRQFLTEQELFAHVGGDNFTMLIRQEGMTERLAALNSMVCSIQHEDRTVPIEISFRMGICRIGQEPGEITELTENARIACMFARQNRKEKLVYCTAELREQYEYAKMLETALQPALHSGEFHIYFQPKVTLGAEYRIIGAEALSRWMHDGVLMKPDSFIPVFERTGMIAEIDMYVYERVCALLREWMDAGLPVVPVSVNFSKITLEMPGFVQQLIAIAARYDVPVQYLEIEFTETCCMENEEKFNVILTTLKNAGFSASLDDFGKGYSSINMLRNMNFDVLKLDKSFHASGCKEMEGSRIILRSIIRMAHDLGLQVISEGVETAEQVACLKELKCEQAQGYYFNKPLPPEQFLERLKKGVYDDKE